MSSIARYQNGFRLRYTANTTLTASTYTRFLIADKIRQRLTQNWIRHEQNDGPKCSFTASGLIDVFPSHSVIIRRSLANNMLTEEQKSATIAGPCFALRFLVDSKNRHHARRVAAASHADLAGLLEVFGTPSLGRPRQDNGLDSHEPHLMRTAKREVLVGSRML
jgi:hypothetical protein